MLHKKSRTVSPAMLIATLGLIGLMAAGCGKNEAPAQKSSSPSVSTAGVSASEHEAFEKKYTAMCIKSQQANPSSDMTNDQELGQVCQGMAKEVSKRLSKAEVVHFMDKKEFPIEMVMMSNSAANNCLSQKK